MMYYGIRGKLLSSYLENSSSMNLLKKVKVKENNGHQNTTTHMQTCRKDYEEGHLKNGHRVGYRL